MRLLPSNPVHLSQIMMAKIKYTISRRQSEHQNEYINEEMNVIKLALGIFTVFFPLQNLGS